MTGNNQTYSPELMLDFALGLTDEGASLRIQHVIVTDEEAKLQLQAIREMLADGLSPDEILDAITAPEVLTSKSGKFKWSWVAAIAAFLVIAYMVVQIIPDGQGRVDQLVELALEENYPPATVRGDEAQEAYQAYASGDYTKARMLFAQMEDPKPEDRFYGALSALYAEHPSEALMEFRALSNGDHAFAETSKWFLALSALKINSCQEASTSLHYLVEKNGYKANDARVLLDALAHEPCTD